MIATVFWHAARKDLVLVISRHGVCQPSGPDAVPTILVLVQACRLSRPAKVSGTDKSGRTVRTQSVAPVTSHVSTQEVTPYRLHHAALQPALFNRSKLNSLYPKPRP